MTNRDSVYVDNMNVIHMLIQKVIHFVYLYSTNIADSLSIGWSNYQNSPAHKKERYLQKIHKKIEQLSMIEKKKCLSCESLTYELKQIVSLGYTEKKISSKRKKQLLKEIEIIDSCSVYLSSFLEMYLEMEEKNKKELKNKKEQIVLPKLKKVKKEKKIQVFTDNNGYVYFHVFSLNGVMMLDKESFAYENRLYEESLNHHQPFAIWDTICGKLSPFEKRRKIFIQSMFSLEENLLRLKEKEIDITYPVEKYFVYSKQILDYLYKEVLSFKEKNTVLDTLQEMTTSAYGCYRLLPIYDSLVSTFVSKTIDAVVHVEILRAADACKVLSDFIEFKNITHVVPTLDDIKRLLYLRIIKNIHIDFEKYFSDMDYKLMQVTQYMSEEEVFHFYEEMKTILLRNCMHDSNKILIRYKNLQASVAKILSKRLEISSVEVVKQYLKEDVLF